MSGAVAVILGRPNVGKSSLFNKLTGARRALVGDEAGLTRDLRRGLLQDRGDLTLVDTGGLVYDGDTLSRDIARRIWDQVADCDLVLLLTDASVGPTGFDEELVSGLRKMNVPILSVVNKVDRGISGSLQADYAPLGLGEPLAISARTGRGLALLRRRLEQCLPPPMDIDTASKDDTAQTDGVAQPARRIVLCGRPNAGKSTLLNRLCEADRALVSDTPGTTRDDVEVEFARGDAEYVLTDTAGVQRRWRQTSQGHILAAARSLSRLRSGSVVLLLVDVREGMTEQDVRLLGSALEAGCAAVLVFSKADLLTVGELQQVQRRAQRRLDFASFVPVCSISSHTGRGIDAMLQLLDEAIAGTEKALPTARLNQILQSLVHRHPPPLVRGRRTSLRYAHAVADGAQAGGHPRLIRIHGSGISRLSQSYRRYLESGFRRALQLGYAPVKVEFRAADNPYAPPAERRSAKRLPAGRRRRRSGG